MSSVSPGRGARRAPGRPGRRATPTPRSRRACRPAGRRPARRASRRRSPCWTATTSTGQPVATSSSSRRVGLQRVPGVLAEVVRRGRSAPPSRPDAQRDRPLGQRRHGRRPRRRPRRRTRPGAGGCAAPAPPAWVQTSPAPNSAATSARPGSAPAPGVVEQVGAGLAAGRAPTSARQVSTLITRSGWRRAHGGDERRRPAHLLGGVDVGARARPSRRRCRRCRRPRRPRASTAVERGVVVVGRAPVVERVRACG